MYFSIYCLSKISNSYRVFLFFFFSSRRRHTRYWRDWSSDVCSSDLELTMIGRTVAICTNGTRVLGLGDIGPVASMPVMEGKAVFYHQLAGVSAMPILIDTKDVDEFVETVVRISPTFGGIHLEDISAPECFEIEARLIEALLQPVMHDDVHGTAVVTLAAALVACRHAGLRLRDEVVGQIGLGAAGFGIAALMVDAGAKKVDRKSTRLNSSHANISYAVFCLKKKNMT